MYAKNYLKLKDRTVDSSVGASLSESATASSKTTLRFETSKPTYIANGYTKCSDEMRIEFSKFLKGSNQNLQNLQTNKPQETVKRKSTTTTTSQHFKKF